MENALKWASPNETLTAACSKRFVPLRLWPSSRVHTAGSKKPDPDLGGLPSNLGFDLRLPIKSSNRSATFIAKRCQRTRAIPPAGRHQPVES